MTAAGGKYRVVLVTCVSMDEARRIARGAVEKRLAGCVNILPAIESFYRWKGKVERNYEVLAVIKTTTARLRELEKEVKSLHSHEVPEFLVLPVVAGSQDYLKWISENVQ